LRRGSGTAFLPRVLKIRTGEPYEDRYSRDRQRGLRLRHGCRLPRKHARNRSDQPNPRTAEAVAAYIRYGVPLGRKVDIIDDDYDALKGARVVLVTSGINEKACGATDRNASARDDA
jgi:hypothetical protein